MSVVSGPIGAQTDTVAAAIAEPREGRWGGRVRELMSLEPWPFISAGLFILIVLFVIIAPFFLPPATSTDPIHRLEAPSAAHWLGTDGYGRDQFARLAMGGRGSLGLAACVTITTTLFGGSIGLISGYWAKVGAVVMRVMDAWMAFPSIILAMLFAVAFGPSFWTVLVALLIIFTPAIARMVRSRVMEVHQQHFIEAARVAGAKPLKIMVKHIIPNVLPLVLVQVVITAAASMLADGGLSFLGLGIAPPTPTWGNMISDGQNYLQSEPWLVIAPGVMIAISVFLLNTIGNGLRSIVDPRYRQMRELQYAVAHRGVDRNLWRKRP